tara:strand:- start:11652 stop:12401 length:750 start_codon:yes stop_codon:yes gene_type:complete
MARNVFTYIGAGQVYLQRLDQSTGLLPIGDVSALELAIETSEITLTQHTQAGGGNLDKIDRIDSFGLSMTLSELSKESIAMALYGDSATVAAGTVTDEQHDNIVLGALLKFENQPDASVAPTVTNTAKDVTYVAGTDYTVTSLGIIPMTAGSITADSSILVSYTKLGVDVVQLLTNSGYEYGLVFEGLNEANSGIAQPIELYRIKFSPTSGLGLITEEFGSLELSGEALVDTTKTGNGVSRYGKMYIPQ